MNTTRWALRDVKLALLVLSIVTGWLGRDQLATRLELESLAAIVALTTFLVGFSTVRLQTRLEEHRAATARHTDRVLEENIQADMLPLPAELKKLTSAEDYEARDRLALATDIFSIFNLLLSALLVFFHWTFYEGLPDAERDTRYSYVGYILLMVLHLLVVTLGSLALFETNRRAREDKERSIFKRYTDLEDSLNKWLEQQGDEKEVNEACDKLDEVLPNWAWLTLIRGSLRDPRCDISTLKRIHASASREKDRDDYSLIAYVWTAYLKDSIETTNPGLSASTLVRLCELERVAEFVESSILRANQSGWIYARLSLNEVQREVKKRGMSDHLKQLLEGAKRSLTTQT